MNNLTKDLIFGKVKQLNLEHEINVNRYYVYSSFLIPQYKGKQSFCDHMNFTDDGLLKAIEHYELIKNNDDLSFIAIGIEYTDSSGLIGARDLYTELLAS